MNIKFENYPLFVGFGSAFSEVRDFLFALNEDSMSTPNFPWGRWEWMFSLPYLETNKVDQIGLWRDGEKLVALATYESGFGDTYFCVHPQYAFLKKDLLEYAIQKLSGPNGPHVLIADADSEFQELAKAQGLVRTEWSEPVSIIDLSQDLSYTLPEGFSTVNLRDRFDLCQYNRVLHRGFNHPGDEINDHNTILSRLHSLSGPDVRLEQNIAVVAPNANFVSYCGMWYKPGSKYALVEPVATDPAYRKMGLGKAAVLEALQQCRKRGAIQAFVGSRQDFYYRIGFRPYSSESFWEFPKK